VTQPPYDATCFSLRQTWGHIGVFDPFTSMALGEAAAREPANAGPDR
jgi:hypothetical protein